MKVLKQNAFGLISFLLIFVILTASLFSMNASTKRNTKASLEKAMQRGIMEYYVENGHYPESLKDLAASYPLRYDKKEFKVTYTITNTHTLPHYHIEEK